MSSGIYQTTSTLVLLLDRLFDYAGMYPPASLAFEEALNTAAALPKTLNRPYILAGDLVVSPENLNLFRENVFVSAGFDQDRVLGFCVLGSAVDNKIALISDDRLEELSSIKQFENYWLSQGIHHQVLSYELKVSNALITEQHHLRIALRNIKAFFEDQKLFLFLEPDLSVDDWDLTLEKACLLIKDLNENCRGPDCGLKIRGSGNSAINNQRIVRVLDRICHYGIHLKATAGLHHPIIEPTLYCNSLGFLNLSVALALKRTLGDAIPNEDILNCLYNQDRSQFSFGLALGYRDYLISEQQVRESRKKFHFSIGSCNITEPDQDLTRLGW